MFFVILNLSLTALNIWWAIENFRYGHKLPAYISLGAAAFCFAGAMLQITSNVGF
jgi:hypothetical protein